MENVTITDVAAEGKSIARVNDMVVFVPFAVPGDIVDLQVRKKKHSYCEAEVIRFIEYSKVREVPMCEHFGICGGCKWQNLPYEEQLKAKQKQVYNQLTRIGKVELPEMRPILGSVKIKEYRNKLEFGCSNKRWLTKEEINSGSDGYFPSGGGQMMKNDKCGINENDTHAASLSTIPNQQSLENMTPSSENVPTATRKPISQRNAIGFHITGAFDKILPIEKCMLMDNLHNNIRNEIRDYALANGLTFFDLREQHGLLRDIIIRNSNTGEWMVIVQFHYDEEGDEQRAEALLGHLAAKFPQITSLMYVNNQKCNDTIGDQDVVTFKGKDYIYETMEDLKFKVGPKSFYQTNTEQAYHLYSVAREFAGLTGDELVYDLYTGTGTIANFVAGKARKVIGIEYVPEAIEDAKVNSEINGIGNTLFYAGDMKDILNDEFIATHGRPDVIITDPPRAGMHADVVKTILRAAPKRIVYVSCNPATQARDISDLDTDYKVTAVQPVDMFPHTPHVENVVLLERKDNSIQ